MKGSTLTFDGKIPATLAALDPKIQKDFSSCFQKDEPDYYCGLCEIRLVSGEQVMGLNWPPWVNPLTMRLVIVKRTTP